MTHNPLYDTYTVLNKYKQVLKNYTILNSKMNANVYKDPVRTAQ